MKGATNYGLFHQNQPQLLQMAHNYEIGTRAWQPDQTEGWVPSELVAKNETPTGVDLVFKLENGEVKLPCKHSKTDE